MMLLKNFWKKENKEVKFGLTREYQKTYRTDHNDYIFNEAPIVSYKKFMLKNWIELPKIILTSSKKNIGLVELKNYINYLNSKLINN